MTLLNYRRRGKGQLGRDGAINEAFNVQNKTKMPGDALRVSPGVDRVQVVRSINLR